jgi:hypothetical protein
MSRVHFIIGVTSSLYTVQITDASDKLDEYVMQRLSKLRAAV